MNISEANDVNIVLAHLFNLAPVPDSDTARDAAARLADRAYRPLNAGLNGNDVNRLWPQRRGVAPGSQNHPDTPSSTGTPAAAAGQRAGAR